MKAEEALKLSQAVQETLAEAAVQSLFSKIKEATSQGKTFVSVEHLGTEDWELHSICKAKLEKMGYKVNLVKSWHSDDKDYYCIRWSEI